MDCVDGLEYRGEGNGAIVFANPKTRHVYRLVKKGYTKKNRTNHLSTSPSGNDCLCIQNVDGEVCSKLDDAINYVTNIMDPLLSFNYAVIPELICIPNGFGEQAVKQIGDLRPVHRRKCWEDEVDPDISTALVLSDCCFVRAHKSNCASILSRISPDPCSDAEDCVRGVRGHRLNTHLINNHSSYVCPPGCKGVDRYNVIHTLPDPCDGSPVFYQEYHLYNKRRDSSSCPALRLHLRPCCHLYHTPGQVSPYRLAGLQEDATSDVILEPQVRHPSPSPSQSVSDSSSSSCCVHLTENLSSDHTVSFSTTSLSSTAPPSTFTLSIEIKPKKGFKTKSVSVQEDGVVDDVCRFCMHKYLKTKRGKWPETSSYCPLDLFSGDKRRMKHALISLIKTPQNNLKICKNGCEVYGSDIREDLPELLHSWLPDCKEDKRPRVIGSFINLIIEILLRVPQGQATAVAKEISSRRVQVLESTVQTCTSSSYVHCDKDHGGHRRPSLLPTGCVLERIQSIQALDTVDIAGIFPLYSRLKQRMQADHSLSNNWCVDGPYTDVSWLGIDQTPTNDLQWQSSDEYAVLKLKQFLVSKTLQDCSIIAAIEPVSDRSATEGYDCLWFEGHLYRYSISLVDLEPKCFDKVTTYFKQASDIADSFAECSDKDRDTLGQVKEC